MTGKGRQQARLELYIVGSGAANKDSLHRPYLLLPRNENVSTARLFASQGSTTDSNPRAGDE
jgi:hypothetical protein